MESLLKLGRSIVESPEFDTYSELGESFFQTSEDRATWPKSARDRLAPFLEKAFRIDSLSYNFQIGLALQKHLERKADLRLSVGYQDAHILSPRCRVST